MGATAQPGKNFASAAASPAVDSLIAASSFLGGRTAAVSVAADISIESPAGRKADRAGLFARHALARKIDPQPIGRRAGETHQGRAVLRLARLRPGQKYLEDRARGLVDELPAVLDKRAPVDVEAKDFRPGENAHPAVLDLARGPQQPRIDPHFPEIVGEPSIAPVHGVAHDMRRRLHPGVTVGIDERDRGGVDSETDGRPELPHRRPDQRVDAGRVAHGPVGLELSRQILAAALEFVAGGLSRLLGVAALRQGPGDAGGQPALTHEAADRERSGHRSAGRMEIDRQLALAEPVQQCAQALRRAAIDHAVGGDPLVAAPPASMRLSLGHEEGDRRRGRRARRFRQCGRRRTENGAKQHRQTREHAVWHGSPCLLSLRIASLRRR